MCLRGPKSLREVDGPSLILIDFYVPALTPRLNSTETSLQLSENITLKGNLAIISPQNFLFNVLFNIRIIPQRELAVKSLEVNKTSPR
jgi:hypothetical protein